MAAKHKTAEGERKHAKVDEIIYSVATMQRRQRVLPPYVA